MLVLTTGWLCCLLPMGNALRDRSMCSDAQCPCATQQGSIGSSPRGAAVELFPNPAGHHPAPSLASHSDSLTAVLRAGKMASRAWYTPGLPGFLDLPASFHQSAPQNIFSLPSLLICVASTLLSPGLFPLAVPLVLLGRACKPLQATAVLERESHDPLESAVELNKDDTFILPSVFGNTLQFFCASQGVCGALGSG